MVTFFIAQFLICANEKCYILEVSLKMDKKMMVYQKNIHRTLENLQTYKLKP